MNRATRHPVVLAWLQLLRPPNLFTVAGDPLAGFALAGGLAAGGAAWRVALGLALATLLFYMGGLLWNDVADFAEDLRERPERPLPRGLVSRRAALWAGIGLAVLGLALAAGLAGRPGLVTGGVLVALIAAYDGVLKRFPGVGEVAMGLCRGVSLALGASAMGSAAQASARVLLAAATGAACIAAVTAIARHETRQGPRDALLLLPAFVLGAGFGAVQAWGGGLGVWSVVCAAAAVGWSAWLGLRAWGRGGGPHVPRTVGAMIRGLLLVQAAWLFAAPGGWPLALGILALWPLSVRSARWFYAS